MDRHSYGAVRATVTLQTEVSDDFVDFWSNARSGQTSVDETGCYLYNDIISIRCQLIKVRIGGRVRMPYGHSVYTECARKTYI